MGCSRIANYQRLIVTENSIKRYSCSGGEGLFLTDCSLSATVSTASLSQDENWYLAWTGDVDGRSPAGNAYAYGRMYLILYDITQDGLGMNKSQTGENWSQQGSLISKRLVEGTDGELFSVFLSGDEYKPTGSTIEYWVSNDNQTTWEEYLYSDFGNRHIFLTPSTDLYYQINMSYTDENNIRSPLVRNFDVEVIPSNTEDISIDVGGSGTANWNFEGVLNTTTYLRM